eukprot:5778137-Prymnesium_polylepis.2
MNSQRRGHAQFGLVLCDILNLRVGRVVGGEGGAPAVASPVFSPRARPRVSAPPLRASREIADTWLKTMQLKTKCRSAKRMQPDIRNRRHVAPGRRDFARP